MLTPAGTAEDDHQRWRERWRVVVRCEELARLAGLQQEVKMMRREIAEVDRSPWM